MAMDVFDGVGNHIGVVHKRFPYRKSVCMIALTDVKAEELNVNISKIKKHVAAGYDCKSMMGSIDDEKLENILDGLLGIDSKAALTYEERIVAAFLLEFGEKNLAGYMDEDILKNHIKGYVLYDMKEMDFQKGGIVIKENIDCCHGELGMDWLEESIYARIIDYPVLDTNIMGGLGVLMGADLTDLGGRNHIHTTEIRIQSGNYIDRITLPIIVDCKKGMDIYLNVQEQRIDKVFCDGRVYRFY